MRGKAFHNMIVEQAGDVFRENGWQVNMEYRYCEDNITNYLDLFAVRDNKRIACEVETTPRHVLDNAAKAILLGIELLVVVPSRRVRQQIERKLAASLPDEICKSLKVMLIDQLAEHLNNHLS